MKKVATKSFLYKYALAYGKSSSVVTKRDKNDFSVEDFVSDLTSV